jgi:hypothetical protein
MAETPPQPPPAPASSEPPLGTPPPDTRVPAGTSGGSLEAGAPSPAAEAPAPPAARWVGESRTITRTVEGPGGELVEQTVEHQPAEYVQGVPARDLSQEELDALTAEQRQLVATSGLYAAAPALPPTSGVATAAPQKEGA